MTLQPENSAPTSRGAWKDLLIPLKMKVAIVISVIPFLLLNLHFLFQVVTVF